MKSRRLLEHLIALLVMIALLPLQAGAQESAPTQDLHTYHCVRLEAGYQQTTFVGAGYARVRHYDAKGVLGASDCRCATVNLNYGPFNSPAQFALGLKAGYENAWGGLLCGAMEAGLLTNFKELTPTLTPKAGFSVYNVASLLYGYCLFDEAHNPYQLGHHQITLNVQWNRALWH